MSLANQAIRKIKKMPVLRSLLKFRYKKKFSTTKNMNLFFGEHASYEEALKHCPNSFPKNYNNEKSAAMYFERMVQINYTDYPMIFWLEKFLFQCSHKSVFDYGGHVGVSYYAYKKIVSFPQGHSWHVYDVPAVVKMGKKIAAKKNEQNIFFSEVLSKDNYFGLGFISGSPQYSKSFYADLEKINLPNTIMLNMIPCTIDTEFFTLNNIGTAICPYHIFNKNEFESFFIKKGYQMLDSWCNEGKTCDVSYSTQKEVSYYGWAFKRMEENSVLMN
jgi:putative methyltransferase (TIGR04325 family)